MPINGEYTLLFICFKIYTENFTLPPIHLLDKLRENVKLEVEKEDRKYILEGVAFSYGHGEDVKTADARLYEHKGQREAAGKRGKGLEGKPGAAEGIPRPYPEGISIRGKEEGGKPEGGDLTGVPQGEGSPLTPEQRDSAQRLAEALGKPNEVDVLLNSPAIKTYEDLIGQIVKDVIRNNPSSEQLQVLRNSEDPIIHDAIIQAVESEIDKILNKLPNHTMRKIPSGNFKGDFKATVVEGEHKNLIGIGKTHAKARKALAQAIYERRNLKLDKELKSEQHEHTEGMDEGEGEGGVSLSIGEEHGKIEPIFEKGELINAGTETDAIRRLRRYIEAEHWIALTRDAFSQWNVSQAWKSNDTGSGRFLERLAQVFGKKVVFFRASESIPGFNGVISTEDPSTIYINADTQEPHLFVLGHEMLHALKTDNPALYEKFLSAVESEIRYFKAYKDKKNADMRQAGFKPISSGLAREELLADFVGEQFLDKTFWDKLQAKDPSLFSRVIRFAKELIDRIVTVFRGKQDIISSQFFRDIRKAQDILAEVLKDYALQDAITDALRIAAEGSKIELKDKITIDPNQMRQALQAWNGGDMSKTVSIKGLHKQIRLDGNQMASLMQFSLSGMDMTTPYHEAFHSVQELLLNDNEIKILGRAYPAIGKMSSKERQAEAFGRYAVEMKGGKKAFIPNSAVRQIFKKIAAFFERLRNALNGLGFQNAEDIFGKAFRGEYREAGLKEGKRQPETSLQIDQTTVNRLKPFFQWANRPAPKAAPQLRGFEQIEKEMAASRGIRQAPFLQKVREFIERNIHEITRHWVYMDSKTDGAMIDILSRQERVPALSKAIAVDNLKEITRGLTPSQYDLFSKFLIARDIMRDIGTAEKPGILWGEELPFGAQNAEEFEAFHNALVDKVNADDVVLTAVNKRQQLMGAITRDAVEEGLLPSGSFKL